MSGSWQITTRSERELAVAHWLLSAATLRAFAVDEWKTGGVTALQCGTLFAAVRIPAAVVHAAAGTEVLSEVDEYLRGAVHGGPVIYGANGQQYYALVPASIQRTWTVPGTAVVGRGDYLGVPSPDLVRYPGRAGSYWSVPMDSPAVLCTQGAVSQLALTGRYRMAAAAAS